MTELPEWSRYEKYSKMVDSVKNISADSDMLNRILREKNLAFSAVTRKASFERRLDDIIE
jgi:hypothetical protein